MGITNREPSGKYPADPYQIIINGFHIHMDYAEKDEALALGSVDNSF